MEKNVYSSPENCGLSLVTTIDEPGLSYQYNTFLIVKHNDSGRIYYAMDSGCSCPIPFGYEYFNNPDDTSLIEITPQSFSSFEASVNSFPVKMSERQSCISLIKDYLKA